MSQSGKYRSRFSRDSRLLIFALSPLQLVCYYTNWSQYRTKIGKFLPEDIQPDLCTHVIFAFGWLKKNKLTSFESNDETKDGKIGLYERVVNLKKANPSLKVLLAIGKSSLARSFSLSLPTTSRSFSGEKAPRFPVHTVTKSSARLVRLSLTPRYARNPSLARHLYRI